MPISVTSSLGAGNVTGLDFTIERGVNDIVPEGVAFKVTRTTLTAFGIAAPANVATDRDARLHDLLFVWAFGETGSDTWTAPQRLLSGWNNRQLAYGPEVTHMFVTGGSKNVTLSVYRFSTGQWGTVTKSISNRTQESACAGANTICVNNIGDSDFSLKPAGAQEFNVDSLSVGDAAWTALRAASGDKRILYKRGGSWACQISLTSTDDADGIIMGAYGDVGLAKPILNAPEVANGTAFHTGVNGAGRSAKISVKISDITFSGAYNYATNTLPGTGIQAGVVNANLSVNLVLRSCTFTGLAQSVYIQESLANSVEGLNLHMDNCHVTNSYGQYATMMSITGHAQGCMGLTGNAFTQNVDAVSDPEMRAMNRCQSCYLQHYRGNDVFNTDDSQQAFKSMETPQIDGIVITMHHNVLEAGLSVLSFGRNVGESFGDNAGGFVSSRAAKVNALIENNILIGNHRTSHHVECFAGGLTFRGNLCVLLNQTFRTNYSVSFVRLNNWIYNANVAGGEPQRIYSNTLINVRTHANNNNAVPLEYDQNVATNYGTYTDILAQNNVIHQPNASPAQVVSNLDATTVLCVALQKGYKEPTTPYAVTANTVPTDSNIYSWAPLTGASAVIGQATTGLSSFRALTTAYRESVGNITGVLPVGGRSDKSAGAYEPALAS